MTEQALMTGLANGDPNAIRSFYTEFRPRILAIAMRLVHNEWDAEDVLQDVVWTVVRKADTFRGDSQFSSWLFRVTQNSAKMLLRKRKRVPMLLEDDVLEVAMGDDHSPRMDDVLDHRAACERVVSAVEQLDPINRMILTQATIDCASTEEMSATTGLSQLAVKARLHRTRHMLKEFAGWNGLHEGHVAGGLA